MHRLKHRSPGFARVAAVIVAVAWTSVASDVRGDGPLAADAFARVASGDATGALVALSESYLKGALDMRTARLYQDLRVEAGQSAKLIEETKAAFPEPRSLLGQYLLARLAPRRELDAAIQRLLPQLPIPDVGLALLDQAWASLDAENVPHALVLLPKIKKLAADVEEATLFEARLLETRGDRVPAERLLAAWCASHPDCVDARKAWVEVLLALRRTGDAAAAAEQALGRVRAPAFLVARAAVAIESRDFEKARLVLDEAKEGGRPSIRAEANALRSAVKLSVRDTPGALACAQAGLDASPRSVPALRAMARALEVEGKLVDARNRLELALDVRPGWAPLLADRGIVLHALGQTKEAKRSLAEARKRDPQHLEAILYQGIMSEDDGDWVGAEKAYRAVLKIDADRLEAHRMLGGVLFSMGQLEPARVEATWIQDRYPKDPNAWFLTGRIELKADKFDEALAAFDKAVECDPKYALGHTGRGWVLEEQDRAEDAKKAYLAAIASDPALPLPHRYLAELLEAQENNPEAAKHFKAYLDLGGADPDEDVKHAVERLSK